MTYLEIQTWIEENMYHPDGTPMIDVQCFYEGAKWMRDQALDTSNVMPRSLTAENGAKALLMGEFKEVLTLLDDDGNEINYEVPVSWSTIKEIYDKVVSHYGA